MTFEAAHLNNALDGTSVCEASIRLTACVHRCTVCSIQMLQLFLKQ